MSDLDPPETPAPPSLPQVMLEDEMRRSYLDYAMSVIVSRALPDARDGLKPVHRRILYAMQQAGYTSDKPYRKSAQTVGVVMGNYHPHGDASIYDALVRMAQTFSMRVPLIDGQGNFGSVDGDPPAAMRYTESRLSKASNFILLDIDKDTVDFTPTYDESNVEPRVLPASYPVLLINGANGIAVGMATNIPPHNPTEIIDATLALIAEPATTLEELMQSVPGPDFPTGGLILGRAGIRSAFEGGRGSVVVRAKAAIEEMKGNRQAIIITEIPYQVNKSTLLERIADLVRAKAVEGITDLRDESDRDGMRIVIELRREATAEVVLNQLYRFTQLQTSFGVNMLALDGGRPRLMGLKDALEVFIAFREDVILRRSRFELNKARERAHLLVGLAIAVANIDDMIRVIRESPDAATARAAMMNRAWPAGDVSALLALIDDSGNQIVDDTVRLTDAQARGILELRLARLTGLERDKIQAELVEVATRIGDLLEILDSRPRRLEVMRDELLAARAEIDSPRMTAIVDAAVDQDDESLIEPGQMVVTITRDGFIKRTALEIFRQQNRGGRGRTAAGTRGDDIVTRSFNAHTHQWVLFFSSGGKAFREKVWRLPEASPTAKGRALVNMLPELGVDGITTVLPLPQDEGMWESLHLVFATASGNVRRNKLSDFRNVRASGLIAMKLDEGDRLIGVATCRDGDDVFLATRLGRCLRFQIADDSLRGVQRARQLGRARHPAGEWRRGDQPIGAAPHGRDAGRARGLPQGRRGPAPLGRRRRDLRGRGGAGYGGDVVRRTRGRFGGRRGDSAHRHGRRVRQAVVGVRLPGRRPRRHGHQQHNPVAPQRHGGRRELSRAARRRRDAGDRRGPADPRAVRPSPRHRPDQHGRHPVPAGRHRARHQRIPGSRRAGASIRWVGGRRG